MKIFEQSAASFGGVVAAILAWHSLALPLPAKAAQADEWDSETVSAEASDGEPDASRRGRREWRDISGGPRVAIGQNIVVRRGETADAVVVVGGSAKIDGDVDGNVVVVLGNATVNGAVAGNLVQVLSTVELGPRAAVEGDAVSVGGALRRDPGARLRHAPVEVAIGNILPNWEELRSNLGIVLRPLPPRAGWAWMIAFVFFIIDLGILLLMPRPVQACAESLSVRPVRCFVVGVLAVILSVALLLLLFWTVVAVPILACALLGASVFGKVVVYRVTGGEIGKQFRASVLEQPIAAFCAGTAIFYVLYMVPVLGWIVWFMVTPLGVGAVIVAALDVFTREGARPPAQAVAPAYPTSAPPTPAAPATPALSTSMASAEEPGRVTEAPPIPSGGAAAAVAAPPIPPLLSASDREGLSSAELASVPRVGFWPRLGASALDVILIAVFNWMTFGLGQTFLLLMIVYHVWMWSWRGTTLGGAVLGLRCVRLDGRALDFQIALVRSIACFLSILPFGLGFIWASVSPDRQSWHDMIAGTTIVKMPKPISLV